MDDLKWKFLIFGLVLAIGIILFIALMIVIRKSHSETGDAAAAIDFQTTDNTFQQLHNVPQLPEVENDTNKVKLLDDLTTVKKKTLDINDSLDHNSKYTLTYGDIFKKNEEEYIDV